jgi:hypothetical protein
MKPLRGLALTLGDGESSNPLGVFARCINKGDANGPCSFRGDVLGDELKSSKSTVFRISSLSSAAKIGSVFSICASTPGVFPQMH